MLQSLKTLAQTLKELEGAIGANSLDLGEIMISLEKFVRTVYGNPTVNRKGDDFMVSLEAAFNIAIKLFSLVDTGSEGIDDRMVEELKKIKARYMGD